MHKWYIPKQPPFGPIYNCHKMDFQHFWKYINENFEKWFIWHSKSPASAPILFIKKNMVPYECLLNIVAWIDLVSQKPILLLLILELLDQLNHAKVYTKIGFRWNAQLGAYSKNQWMKNDIPRILWPFWMNCDEF